MGANTYTQILPEIADDRFDEWPYGDTPTYVTTHEDLPKEADSITFYEGDVRTLVEDTISPAYEHIWLVGGAELAQDFLKQGLIDDIRVGFVSVLLGSGISLFGDSGVKCDLHLKDVTPYESGETELWYEIKYE